MKLKKTKVDWRKWIW